MVEPSLEDGMVERIQRTSLTMRKGEHLDSGAGHSMIARVNADGSLDAGADPRSDGTTFVSGRAPSG